MRDTTPDFVVRPKTNRQMHLIVEAKGYDQKEEIKLSARS